MTSNPTILDSDFRYIDKKGEPVANSYRIDSSANA